MASQPRKMRFYRELLTPLLHRRFTSAAGCVLLACYVEVIFTRSWSSKFWWLFPLGFAGMQTLLFFIPSFAIFILRVSQIHFGQQTSTSPFERLTQLARWQTAATILTYVVCGLFYGEAYMWAAPSTADLSIAKYGDYDRLHLNERPIFLRSNFFLLSLAQGLYHVWTDGSRIPLPKQDPVTTPSDKATTYPGPQQQIQSTLTTILAWAATRASVLTTANLFVYALFMRRTAYEWSRWTGRIIWSISRTDEPGVLPPYHWTLLARSFFSGVLLLFLWDFANGAFNIFVAQEPLKKGNPLTDEAPDPNGSLLNGLKSNKQLAKAFAFWELSLISRSFPDRRKAIFADLDRQGGSAWTQILSACLATLESVDSRINPKPTAPPVAAPANSTPSLPAGLPRLAAPLEKGTVLSPPTGSSSPGARVATIARSLGSSPSQSSPLQHGLSFARSHLPAAEAHALQNPGTAASGLWNSILASPAGWIFRSTAALRVRALVLGSPQSELEVATSAVGAIARLAAASVAEDAYGTVHKDVPTILRVLARSVGAVQAAVAQEAAGKDEKGGEHEGSQEVEELLEHMRAALRFLIEAFAKFAKDVGLGEGELREARKAAGLPEIEMEGRQPGRRRLVEL